ncbi:MAG: DUF1489 family protein [Alphaproteobacteria bacterium]
MALHLIKMAVGVASLEALARRQRDRIERAGNGEGEGEAVFRHYTRNVPRRAPQLLDGGSIYWIIKGAIRARQPIRAIHRRTPEEGRKRCELQLDPVLVATMPQPHRALQGWRYMEDADKPEDLLLGSGTDAADGDGLPPDMAAELRALGLL